MFSLRFPLQPFAIVLLTLAMFPVVVAMQVAGASPAAMLVFGAVVMAVTLVNAARSLRKSDGAQGARLFSFLALLGVQSALLAIATPVHLYAQDVATVVTTQLQGVDLSRWENLIPVAMAIIAPMLIGVIKKAVMVTETLPDGRTVAVLPKWMPKWAPLLIAPALVWLADLLVNIVTDRAAGLPTWVVVLLSTLPTYIRDAADQFKKWLSGEDMRTVTLRN